MGVGMKAEAMEWNGIAILFRYFLGSIASSPNLQ
jgi:hypothetical protein